MSSLLRQCTRQTVSENIVRAQATGNIETLLPSLIRLTLSLAPTLRLAVVLECLVIVVVIKINVESVKNVTGNLAPSTLPLVRASPLACTSHGRLGARKVIRASVRRASQPGQTSIGIGHFGLEQGSRIVGAFQAEPVAAGDAV